MSNSRAKGVNKIRPPDDEHDVARNMQWTVINVLYKGTAHQVGYLPELYQDVRSAKY